MMISRIISSHPDRMCVRYSRMLTIVTVRKINIPRTRTISMIGARNGFMSFIAVKGESTSELDHAQNTSPIIMNILVRTAVITVDRMISSLSGISSLTVIHRPRLGRFKGPPLKDTDTLRNVLSVYVYAQLHSLVAHSPIEGYLIH
jgi:hypothetical protein